MTKINIDIFSIIFSKHYRLSMTTSQTVQGSSHHSCLHEAHSSNDGGGGGGGGRDSLMSIY